MERTGHEEGTTGLGSLRPSHVLDRMEVLALPGWRALAWRAGGGVRFAGDVGD